MKKIQAIRIGEGVQLDALRPLYYRGDGPIMTPVDGKVWLNPGMGFDFLTYFNSLAIGKWRKYTKVENFYLVLDVEGSFSVDLIGHLPKSSGRQKEWASRLNFDAPQRREIVIPVPRTMQSDIVSFGLVVHSRVAIYDAYYAADVNVMDDVETRVAILTEVKEDPTTVAKNMDLIAEELLNDRSYARRVIYTALDEEGIMDLRADHVDSVQVTRNRSDLEVLGSWASHILKVDERVRMSAETIRRLLDLTSVLKDEYAHTEIAVELLLGEQANILLDATFKSPENIVTYADKLPQYRNRDMANWANVVDEAALPVAKEDIYLPALITATAVDDFDFETLTPKNAKQVNGFTAFRKESECISMSGMCAWMPKGRKALAAARVDGEDGTVLVSLQDLVLPGAVEIEVTRNMYFRGRGRITRDEDGIMHMASGQHYDFFTYFNAFSLEKWKKYTHVDNVYLRMVAKGDFTLELFGHYKSKVGYQKEWLGQHEFRLADWEEVVIAYPRGLQSQLIAFQMMTHNDVQLSSVEYVTELPEELVSEPRIAMCTTTFRKEAFIERNIELMTDQLLTDEDYKDKFHWYIVDNGQSLVPAKDLAENITIIPNRNLGGAGGFGRGQMEAMRSDFKPTHILFMDDDVVFIPESFKKLSKLLSVIKPEFAKHFISGAMLKTGEPNIQHENTAWINELGYNEPVGSNLDLNLWDSIIRNEEINDSMPNRYGAWWFCCVPTTTATLDNLPMPVFFRGDDIEYSLRNRAKLITMNGLCIWHESFEGRFSASLDFYLTVRNKLALRATNPDLENVDMIGHVVENFWEEMHKFDYKGASLFLDAIEDYMKGPDFYRTMDGAAMMVEKKGVDNKLKPINPEIRGKIDFAHLYDGAPLKKKKFRKFEETHNGQMPVAESAGAKAETAVSDAATLKADPAKAAEARKAKTLAKYSHGKSSALKKVGVIPYGWGSWPGKVYGMDEVIAVEPANDTYVLYKKDLKEFARLKARFEELMLRYDAEHEAIEQAYRDAHAELTSEAF